MTESRLSQKTKLCQAIKQFSDAKCQELLQEFQKHSCCDDAQSFLIKLLFVKDNTGDELFTNDSLKDLNRYIYAIQTSVQLERSSVETSTCTAKSSTQDISQNSNISHSNSQNETFFFPIQSLPLEMIRSIGHMLNKKDILGFESCSRSLYQIVNTFGFLQDYNGFAHYTLDETKLQDIYHHSEWDLFKLSKCRSLFVNISLNPKRDEIDSISDVNTVQQWCNIRIDYFKKILTQNKFQSNWLTSMFESLERLHIFNHGIILLPLLPIDLLFDNRKSHLNEFRLRLTPRYHRLYFRHYLDWKLNYYSAFYVKFEQNYIEYFEQFEDETNKKTSNGNSKKYEKCLQIAELRPCILTMNIINNDLLFKSFDPKWLILTYCGLDKDMHQLKQYLRKHPNIKQLSMRRIYFRNQNNNNDKTIVESETSSFGICSLKITTYREENLFSAYDGFLDNQTKMNELNFQNSVKNITLYATIGDNHFDNDPYRYDSVNDGKEFATRLIMSLLKKVYLHKLENINLLFELIEFSETQRIKFVDWFFRVIWSTTYGIFKCTSLKQVNVGLKVVVHGSKEKVISEYVFSWSKSSFKIEHDRKYDYKYDQECNKYQEIWRQISRQPGQPIVENVNYSQANLQFDNLVDK